MKRLFVAMVMTLVMTLVSSVAFAAQVVELNEAYSVEQTRRVVSCYLPEYFRFNYSMRREKDPNSYTHAYATKNQSNWKLIVYQNGQGYACIVGMIIPDSESKQTIASAGTVLLATATGTGDYNWNHKDKIYQVADVSLNALKCGKDSFYCKETHRYYALNTRHYNGDWYLIVVAYVYDN